MSSCIWHYSNPVSVALLADTCTLLYTILPQMLSVFPQKRKTISGTGVKNIFFRSSTIPEKRIDFHRLISLLLKICISKNKPKRKKRFHSNISLIKTIMNIRFPSSPQKDWYCCNSCMVLHDVHTEGRSSTEL